jgi:hypothetical protein
MKNQKRITFLCFFFIAVLICFEVNTYSNGILQKNCIELSERTGGEENGAILEFDSLKDDQIPLNNKYSAMLEPIRLTSISQNPLLTPMYSSFIWQPPKI